MDPPMARDSTVRPVRAALALVLTLALAPAASARSVEIRGADPERYTLDLRYEDRRAGVLSGSERIEFVNRGPRALTRVWLRLWANGPDDCRPRRLHAATTGATVSEEVSGEERTLRVASEQARDFGLAVGPLRRVQASEGGVQVRVFAGRKVRGSRGALRIARRAVRALSRRLTPYDSTELDVVLVRGGLGAGIGMEYPELVFSIPAADVITHEVAHQWWYSLVGNNQYLEPWLDESFATYSHERLHPNVNFCRPRNPYLLVAPRRRDIRLDSTMRLFERGSPLALGEVVYWAGSCALQRLERDIGRERMTAVLRLLQTRFRHGVMTKSDVLDAIRAAAPE